MCVVAGLKDGVDCLAGRGVRNGVQPVAWYIGGGLEKY